MTLVITDKDMMAFDKLAQQQFVTELCQYCEFSYPKWVKEMGQLNVDNAVNEMISIAKDIGLQKRASIYLVLNVSLLIGGLFYTDDQYKKIRKDYEEYSYLDEKNRVEFLYKSVFYYIDNVDGSEGFFIGAALAQLQRIDGFHLEEDGFDTGLLILLRYCHPEKVAFIGEDMCLRFIKDGKETAKSSHLLYELKQQATFIILQFFLGQVFYRDPFLAWFDWSERLEDIINNKFSFKILANQLKEIRSANMEGEV